MAFPTTYVDWIALVKDWCDVDDMSDARIQVCISLAELRLNRELNSQWMEANITIPVVNANPINLSVSVPSYNRVRLVVAGTNGVPLVTLALNEFQKLVAGQNATGASSGLQPQFYCIEGNNLLLFPVASVASNILLYYYTQVAPLSATVNSNVFSTKHADVLLYACALEVSKFIVEDERIPVWESAYLQALDASNNVAKNSKMGSTPLKREITLYGAHRGF